MVLAASGSRLTALAIALAVVALLGACAPAAAEPSLPPEAAPLERVAHEAYHRMEIGRLRTGSYTTNVLVDLDVPRGARVTVEAFGGSDYVLRVSSDAVSTVAWLVSPRGVRRVAA
jgi:hypothetical protein